MTNKFEGVTKLLTDKNALSASPDRTERVFETAQEMDDGARDGITLIRQWIEAESDEEAVKRVDTLSTVALSLFSFKKIQQAMDELVDCPDSMKKALAEAKTAEVLSKLSKDIVMDASIQWISGFLFGLAFYKFVIASTDEES